MGQFKKPEVRAAIVDSATRLFSRKGYTRTPLSEIAAGADISTATLYVYFRSKLEILYAIYDPWMRVRLTRLEQKMSGVKGSREKIRLLVRTLWRDIPAERNGFVNNLVQAISSATPRDHYKPTTLKWTEEQLAGMLRAAVPAARHRALSGAHIPHLLMMAFDGFVIYRHVHPNSPPNDATIEAVVSMIVGSPALNQRKRL